MRSNTTRRRLPSATMLVAWLALFAAPLPDAAAAAAVTVRDEPICDFIKGFWTCWQLDRLEVSDLVGDRNAISLVEPAADQVAIYDRVAIAPDHGCTALDDGGALCQVAEHMTVLVVAGEAGDMVDGRALTRDAMFEGGGGDDTLLDGRRDGYLWGEAGDDVLDGAGGSDLADGGRGADRIGAGDASDAVYGGSGPDRIWGGRGADDIEAGRGADVVDGGPGRDTIAAGHGGDAVRAADGRRERIDCGPGVDRVTADRGDRLRRCERVRLP
jgi:Ca2+-binding RTX toxin-like protein